MLSRVEPGIQQTTRVANKKWRMSPRTKLRRGDVSKLELGATAVEFALILPLLLVLVVGLIDFGRMGFVQISVTAASRDGARYSSLFSSGLTNLQPLNDFVQLAAPRAAQVAQLSSTGTLSVSTVTCSTAQSGENTTVTVSTNYKWLLPVGLLSMVAPGASWLNDLTITSSGSIRCVN